MNGRHELKYFINEADRALLRARLRVIAKPDAHAGPDGSYRVRSLYFDDYNDKAVTEKLSGLSRREKYRLRYYDGDLSFIRLERKSKANRLAYKESEAVSEEQCAALLAGDYNAFYAPGSPLSTRLYVNMRHGIARPKSIVEYRREAYVYGPGNVRVTMDSDVRTSAVAAGFLDPGSRTVPSAGAIVLEVKFDGFLPDVIRSALQIGSRNQTEFSKYVASRLIL